ncbi:MAG: cell division protein ZipA [Wenzhouxiangella sp.]|nr:cell division protein ZipA [Wenzhouxiangella sp.]
MDNLRLILILLGLLILAGIVLFHRPRGQSQPNHARWLQRRREPSLGNPAAGDADDHTATESGDDAAVRQSSFPTFSATDDPRPSLATDSPADAGGGDGERQPARGGERMQPDKIISLFVRRRDEKRINGSELLDAAVKAGLTFGEMSIFHRLHEGDERPVFSMANLTPPGHFDASGWNVFDTPGVALFVTLPGPVSALDAWDAMLATGRRIAELLDAELLDDAKCLLTRQRIAQIREEMREYDRRHGLVGG